MILFNWLSFLIDLPSLDAWLKAQFGSHYLGMMASSNLRIRFDGPSTISEADAIATYLKNLNSNSEATKRSLHSRMRGSVSRLNDLLAFEEAVKEHIASKDLSALTVAEKKLFMGAKLTDDEYDSLTTS